MRFDDFFLMFFLYSVIFGPFVLLAVSLYFAIKKRNAFSIVAAIVFGVWSCWWLLLFAGGSYPVAG